jgi:hypothetical protein
MPRSVLKGLGEKGTVLGVVEPIKHSRGLFEIPLKFRRGQGNDGLEDGVRIRNLPQTGLLIHLEKPVPAAVASEECAAMLEDGLNVPDKIGKVHIGKDRGIRPGVFTASQASQTDYERTAEQAPECPSPLF